MLANAAFRNELVMDLEEAIWRRARTGIDEKTLAGFVSMFEVADCWRHGETPAPSLERSALLWHAVVGGDATLAARAEPILAQRCPVEEEMFRAQQNALVVVTENRNGMFLRDAFFDRPDIRFRDDWPSTFTAHARPIERFLLRLTLFRRVPHLDEIGISRIVQLDRDMEAMRKLLEASGLTPSSPGWGWHMAAMWTAAASHDWARAELGAGPGTPTRH